MRITGVKDKINFTAGKVEVFSDFDGTYCPADIHPCTMSIRTDLCRNIVTGLTNFLNPQKAICILILQQAEPTVNTNVFRGF